MKIGILFVAVLVTLLLAAAVIIYGGFVDVSAVGGHSAPARWLFSTVMRNRVEREARGISVPNLDDEVRIRQGAEAYAEMCEICHAAPGKKHSETAEGLTPEPPRLEEDAPEWKPAELFWVTKNGVKMTGMPAWGPTHSDEVVWNIVAFLVRLPRLTAEEYARLTGQTEHHVPEGAPHEREHR